MREARSVSRSGSSPRMRGTLLDGVENVAYDGIIPADAGNTKYFEETTKSTTDHPRGCGEHSCWCRRRPAGWGSSPRMRGTPDVQPVLLGQGGIIPADAGNTLRTGPMFHVNQDHPRGCGEHRPPRRCRRWPRGSSPRMRGTRSSDRLDGAAHRIIPADAGNT